MGLTKQYFSILRDVMVANAHQEQEPEGKRVFDIGYLVGVVGLLVVMIPLPLMIYYVNGIPFIERCLDSDTRHADADTQTDHGMLRVATIALSLSAFTFTILISLRTRKNLRKLQEEHLKNLPSNNVLTYLDTEILCFSIMAKFALVKFRNIFLATDLLSFDISLYIVNVMPFCFVFMFSLIFPLYIILKTRRYLPSLWDDKAPLILQNNDFYAVRLSEVDHHGEGE